ncbi:YHS domain-containing protein [bacterium]|nr:YHS domain-containing protein [bacterium]
MTQTIKMLLLMMTAMLLFAAEGLAASEIYTGFFSSDAVGGYDTVAYFTEGRPVKGLKAFKTKYKGANWYFSSRENLETFQDNPTRYAPQYGGYCAWAVANGDTAKGDPLQWTIHNNKLYLNYNEEIKNKWLDNIETFITRGDANWPGVIK